MNLQGEKLVPTRVCSSKGLMNCRPKPFHGKEGVDGLTRGIEKIESVIELCFCPENCKVKFSVCTLEHVDLS